MSKNAFGSIYFKAKYGHSPLAPPIGAKHVDFFRPFGGSARQ